jgi:hypothetical protein
MLAADGVMVGELPVDAGDPAALEERVTRSSSARIRFSTSRRLSAAGSFTRYIRNTISASASWPRRSAACPML